MGCAGILNRTSGYAEDAEKYARGIVGDLASKAEQTAKTLRGYIKLDPTGKLKQFVDKLDEFTRTIEEIRSLIGDKFREIADETLDKLEKIKARGEGAFGGDETVPYNTDLNIFGQMTRDSCIAASCRMILKEGESIPEAWVRIATKVDAGEGAFLRDVPDALRQFDEAADYIYKEALSFDELMAATEKGSAMVTLRTSVTGHGRHALVVDGFEDGMVLIRDPLPEGEGSAYKVTIETFRRAWEDQSGNGKAIIPNW